MKDDLHHVSYCSVALTQGAILLNLKSAGMLPRILVSAPFNNSL